LTTNQLNWQQLAPAIDKYTSQFQQACEAPPSNILALQARLDATLNLFTDNASKDRIMLLKAQDSYDYLSLIAESINQKRTISTKIIGARYHINEHQISYHPANQPDDNFAATDYCLFEEWIESERLFGCLRYNENKYALQPGLIHKANGGILVLSLRTILTQPLLWLKLKQTIMSRRFDWVSPDESRPLPVSIPSMPLDIRLILVGDRLELGDFQEIEPEITATAVYAEYESELSITAEHDIVNWCLYLNALSQRAGLPFPDAGALAQLFKIGARFCDDQFTLPLCPVWLSQQLQEASRYLTEQDKHISAHHIEQSRRLKLWRQSYLPERSRSEIEQGQILIATQGYVVGQINGLSVLEYPGHPIPIGEPSRISCVVHLGDGEVTDVERKAELGGNLHAKGMMIMQAFISAELASEQQLPFSASIVFEQSYGEVDGDSASLAELCALLSALSLQPINQQIAVTGSVDQFGNVQAIGGINEKIEAFYDICLFQGLTGTQGVIIPYSNIRHLCLREDVIEAVKNGTFSLFYVDHVAEAISLLTGLPYHDESLPSILSIIQERTESSNQSHKMRFSWPFKWLN
jgi:Lon-like ATP-dependent protease